MRDASSACSRPRDAEAETYLPKLCTDLVTALPRLNVYDFSASVGKSQSGESPARGIDRSTRASESRV